MTVGPLIRTWQEEKHSHFALDPRAFDALATDRIACGWMRCADRVGLVIDAPADMRSEIERLIDDWARENEVEVDHDWAPPDDGWLPGR